MQSLEETAPNKIFELCKGPLVWGAPITGATLGRLLCGVLTQPMQWVERGALEVTVRLALGAKGTGRRGGKQSGCNPVVYRIDRLHGGQCLQPGCRAYVL